MGSNLTARITEILREHFCEYIGGTCLCGEPFVKLRDHSDHVAALIAQAAEEHYRPRVEELGRAMAVLSNTVHELQERQSGLTQPAADPRSFGPDHHDFLPVRGHPDDDECTYRVDGTDATYCGMSRASHELWLPGAGE